MPGSKTLSGQLWVNRFPTSTSTDDLVDPFKSNVKKFIAALTVAGAEVSVSATFRPKERVYLMYWSYRVARGNYDPDKVPEMVGVDIIWTHKDAQGNKSLAASKLGASLMVAGYGIVYPPAAASRHTERTAIDMNIVWNSSELKLTDGNGKDVSISNGAKDGSNIELHKVGKSYGVLKLVSDPPHWSSDGR